ncbi:neuromedin-U-like isoform X1 [Sinocyclocheilus anshuiensis]|uniref:neuromedin-U-like isoform X1 n=1 Tax=Sinocyclocheilus anshuiensis TaxID=1608454 RepID=UPI0007B8F1BF|nr:PREDICTED: neuromedin-U-like isoform X1 [Sinocyclocheilus anshuiensis]XP_016358950.1 PREDICTED: neuromedin-U-like isoform X1 [Sinocyclocheilus anshuiensis]
MRSSSQCERGAAQSAMSPAHNSALMLGVLFISFIPITTSAPVLLNPSSIEHEQLLTQITDLCSFYLSADPSFRTSDVLEDLCFLMLGSLQKSKEITARETSKRSTVLHPLLELIPQLARRRSRRMKLNVCILHAYLHSDYISADDLQGPGRIQSRGYFLYRPRNGRRSDDYV